MKKIKLANNKGTVIVDDDDYEWLSKYSWNLASTTNCNVRYAQATINDSDYSLKIHQAIMRCTSIGIDHRDGDGLNNQKSNLRFATNAENLRNSRKRKVNFKGNQVTSRYKGVAFEKIDKKKRRIYRAYITVNGVQQYLGLYKSQRKAADAYNVAAKKYFGEFARLNP